MTTSVILSQIKNGSYNNAFSSLYSDVEAAKNRYSNAVSSFIQLYGDREAELFSVPGRSEISGNHTDHNLGKVIAAAVDLDIIAIAAKSEENCIRMTSKGYREDFVDISNLESSAYKKGSSASLVAGTCAFFKEKCHNIGGFYAYTTSQVLSGSGLSSSAAFEVMVGNVLNFFYNNNSISAVSLAKIAQKAENIYFGKPCGLMDQVACAVGGFVNIDFENPATPIVKKLDKNLGDFGYTLCITDTGGNHADLTDDYASVPSEMKAVATALGASVLRDVDEAEFYSNIPMLRKNYGDRAVLRAIHFFNENKRVDKQVAALNDDDIYEFLLLVSDSGDSSFKYLQNVYTNKNVEEQGLSLALALSSDYVARVHGGGFAGTIQAFIPTEELMEYKNTIESVFGAMSCKVLTIRNFGAVKLTTKGVVAPQTN